MSGGFAEDAPAADLYEHFAPHVAAIATRIVGCERDVDAIVQDVFLAATKGLQQRDQALSVESWFTTITVRVSLRKLRWRSLWRALGWQKAPSYERLPDDAASPEERRLVVEVYRALDRVSPLDRVAWVLRHVQRQSLEEIAALCGCSTTTVQRRIAAAHAVVGARLSASPCSQHGATLVDASYCPTRHGFFMRR